MDDDGKNEFGVERGKMAFGKYKTPATPDFSVYKGDFIRERITPTDLDGVIEQEGHFCVHEYKKDGKTVPIGQARLHIELHKIGFVIIKIWYQEDDCYKMLFSTVSIWLPDHLTFPNGKKRCVKTFKNGLEGRKYVNLFHQWWTKQIIRQGVI